MKHRLQTLFLLIAVMAVSVGWFADQHERVDTLYFHLYSCRYDFLSNDPSAEPAGWQCMATLAFTSNRTLHFHSPMFYSPTITVDGQINIAGKDTVEIALEIEAYASDLACVWPHSGIINIGQLISCDDSTSGMEDFKFSVSRSKFPSPVIVN